MHQTLGLTKDIVDAAARKFAAQVRDDAEATLVVTAFGDLEVRVVAWRETHALRWHEVEERVVLRRQVLVHGGEHIVIGMGTCDFEHARMPFEDARWVRPETAGDDHFTVLFERLADGVQRFVDRRVDEAAGVDHHEVSRRVVGRHGVALGAQLREDTLGIDEGLRAAEADEADLRRAACFCDGHGSFYRLLRSLSAAALATPGGHG